MILHGSVKRGYSRQLHWYSKRTRESGGRYLELARQDRRGSSALLTKIANFFWIIISQWSLGRIVSSFGSSSPNGANGSQSSGSSPFGNGYNPSSSTGNKKSYNRVPAWPVFPRTIRKDYLNNRQGSIILMLLWRCINPLTAVGSEPLVVDCSGME